MRVGLLAYLMHGGEGYRAAGVSIYARQLLESLARAESPYEYVAFAGRDAPSVRGIDLRVSPVPTVRAPVRIAWEQTGLQVQARAARLDLLHGLVNVLPLLTRIPCVVTVHDLSFLRFPERFHRSKAAYLRAAVALSVRKARHVIAVSGSTRDDLRNLMDVPEEKVSVVHQGVDERFVPLLSNVVTDFRKAATGGRRYILFVGTLEPRKNVHLLIRAFARVRKELDLPHLLVLVGGRGWMDDELFTTVRELNLETHVRFEGYVTPDSLPLWYNGADIFAYPSAYEGFGLPVLEAMACGTPTITTSSSSLVEVAGDACLTVQPGSQEALQVAMSHLLESADSRERCRRLGIQRASGFSWDRTASSTLAVYKRVLDV